MANRRIIASSKRIKYWASGGVLVYLLLQLWLYVSLSPSFSRNSLFVYLLPHASIMADSNVISQPSISFHPHFQDTNAEGDDTDPLLPSSFLDPCLTAANEQHIQPYEHEWFLARKPQFTSVVLAPPIFNNATLYFHVIFNIASMQTSRGAAGIRSMYRHLWMRRGLWFCDGQAAVPLGKGCPNGETLVLRCPQRIILGSGGGNSTTADNEHLDELASAPKSLTIRNDTYFVGDHVQCLLKEKAVKPNPDSIKVAANALLFGNAVLHPRRLVEWMEYHRMIGVDHFFIYYSLGGISKENVAFALPNLKYTTYINYDLMHSDHALDWNNNGNAANDKDLIKDAFRFQAPQQMDAIFRARGLGYDWIIMTDMDEYLQFGDNPQETLHNLTNRFLFDEFGNFTKIGGLSVQSTTYGASHGEPPFPELLIDHIWKRRGMFVGERMKAIVRPQNVNYFAVHGITQGGKEVPVDSAVLRMAHYRHPELGVGFSRKPARDASLQELWHDKLLARVDVIWKLMQQKYNSSDDAWTTENGFHNFHANSATGIHSTK
jgi:hypothetical protein